VVNVSARSFYWGCKNVADDLSKNKQGGGEGEKINGEHSVLQKTNTKKRDRDGNANRKHGTKLGCRKKNLFGQTNAAMKEMINANHHNYRGGGDPIWIIWRNDRPKSIDEERVSAAS